MAKFFAESKYMNFDLLDAKTKGAKTEVTEISSKKSGAVLGYIQWYGPWRQYCFIPEYKTVFNTQCMADIMSVIETLRVRRLMKRNRNEGD